MIASTALENSNISLENYDVLQNSTSENVLPMEISLNTDGIQENSMFVQNYIIRHLDDGNLEMVFCNTETVQNDNENVGKDEGKSVEVHVIQENLTNSKPLGPIKIEKPIINPTVYSCFKCKEQFNNLALFRKHLKWHKSEKKFNCSKCSAGFNIENNLKVHVTIHHPGPAGVCPICKIKFQRKASLKSHMIVHQVEEVFVCDECHAEFQNDDELLKHVEIHAVTKVCKNESDSLVCPYCKLDFTTPSEYKQHVARHLEVKRNVLKGKRSRKRRVRDWASVHKCKYCGKLFPKVCLLERHERIHTGEKPYVCEVCNKSFAQNGTLHIHLGSHTGYKPYSCTLCPAKFTQKGNLRAHIDKTHTAPKGNQKMYKCTQCACIFKKIATLNGHVTKIHLNKGQENVCETENVMDQVMDGLKMMNNAMNKSFTKKNVPGASWVRLAESEANGGVRRYLVRQKKVGDIRWYFCDYCSSRFKKPSDLIRHIRTHTLEKPYKCTKCNMAFSLKSTLTNHHKTHSNQGCDCSFCDNSSKHQRRLDEHIKEHEKNKAANCTCVLCDKVCPLRKGKQQKSVLQTNIQSTQNVKEPFCQKPNDTLRERLDLEESLSPKETKSKFPDVEAEKSLLKRPHHCKICNVRFARFNSLKKHNLYHTGERKYSCSLCSKAFITKYRLTEHLNYHKNIRNHACQICAKKFVTASLLKRHMLVHNTFKPYLCPYCNKTFKTFLMTRTHIRNVHKLNVTQSDVVVDEATSEKNTENQICTVATSDEPVSNPVVLTVAPSENQLELNQDYQMVYLNISDVQLVNNEAAISDSALSTLKLPNESLLFNDTQDGSVLFNVEPVKAPTMVDPNVVIKTDFAKEKPATNMGEVEVFSAVNLSDMPINIIQPEEEKAGMDIFNAQVLCINCHKMFSGMVVFQGHTCSTSTTNPVTNVQVVETPEDNKETTESKLDSPKQSKCRFCPYVTVSDEKFRRHLSFSHADTLDKMCRYCYKDFKKPSDLTRHLRTHTGERPFECSQCKKKFSLKSTLESHKRTHESSGQKNVSCDVCNANFTTKSSLKVHMLLHTGARPHACIFCEQTFRTSAIRRAHEKNIHLNGARRPSSPKGIKLLRTVAEEVVDNLRQQDSIASTEPTVLTSPDPMSLDFLQHIQTSGIVVSEGAIPFSLNDITLLGYGEEEQSTELTSMEDNGGVVDQVQSKPPKVECDICHKMYASKDVLRKHKKNVHGQNKKFPCIKCDKGYDDLEELNKHIVKIHTGYRPYSCQYCSNSFGEENSLKTHIKRIHQKSLLTQETTNALLGLQFDLPGGSII